MAVSGLTSDRSSRSSAPPRDFLACLNNALHASHFTCLEPDLDAARVESRFRENVFHNAASQFSCTLILLCVMLTRSPGLISLRLFPFMLLLLSPFGRDEDAAYDWSHYIETTIACHNSLICKRRNRSRLWYHAYV